MYFTRDYVKTLNARMQQLLFEIHKMRDKKSPKYYERHSELIMVHYLLEQAEPEETAEEMAKKFGLKGFVDRN